MKYFGGKKRVALKIAQYIQIRHPEIENYYEPFCGMCSVGFKLRAKNKYFSDAFKPVITFFNAIKEGWLPPETLTKEQWLQYKQTQDPEDPMTAVAGFGCSFGGKLFDGYAINNKGQDYAKEARNYAIQFHNYIKQATFYVSDYKSIQPTGAVVYLDPPYLNTSKLTQVQNFNHDEFIQYAINLAKTNYVYISEYNLPTEQFNCVLELPVVGVMNGKKYNRIEKLYTVKQHI